ncbi:queuosine precursor transporter [uncultured Eubacterium sp.]|uniref:queuosine precursor transporter n=1 Tax=uncultured Eubacterium sp. TaxID=165185 RepID=UPI0026730E33|nr:queuosine precursor transporter [uncultured Eubacterium sp.]
MSNEVLLVLSILIIYGGEIVFFKLFGKYGLYCFTSIATIAANIEVLIMIKAFGIEMTLGNVLFASTFLVTDIISELYGKKEAKRAVHIGIATSVMFIVLSQWWLLYTPAGSDLAMPSMQKIFSNTPRLMLTSMIVYAIVQQFDVWAYHKWWEWTEKKFGSREKFLWLRNNGSTLISQFLNNLLFTFGAFLGIHSMKTLISIVISSYGIFIVTSLADTPFVYLARKIKKCEDEKEISK